MKPSAVRLGSDGQEVPWVAATLLRWVDSHIDGVADLSLEELGARRFWIASWMSVVPLFLPVVVLHLLVEATIPSIALSMWLVTAPIVVHFAPRLSGKALSRITGTLHMALFLFLGLSAAPADLFSIAFIAMIPMTMPLMLSIRESVAWAAVAFVASTILAVAHEQNFALGQPYPHMDELRTLFALSYVVACTAMGLLFLQQRRAVEADAIRSRRAQTAFLATMSHELRTPMNGVLGMTQLLLQSPLGDEQRDQLSAIRKSSELMVLLLNDILDFSKIQSGKMSIEYIELSLCECVRESVSLFQGVAAAKGLQLSAHCDESVPPTVLGDPTRLRQVVSNLVGNAVKFTSQGVVDVRCAYADGAARIVVTDTGIGIPKEAQKQLFTAFHQVDSDTTRRFGGSGLGLAISQKLVELMRGTISVKSEVNEGSTFTVSVPAEQRRPSLRRLPLVTTDPVGRGRQVLVVDDNAINLAVAKGLLMKLGFDVATADNGKNALERCRHQRFDAIFMDCHMPEMDGFTATRLLRQEPGYAATPIIALTASAMKEDADACIAAKMNDLLPKPLQRASLVAILRKYALGT